jgi:anti-anti-sigma factor
MRVTVERGTPHQAILRLDGQLDIDTGAALHAVLNDLLAQADTRIVVDLAGLTFCDSTGLSAFVLAHQRCTATGGYLRLAAPSAFLLRVLGVVGLRAAVPVFRTVEAARTGDPRGLVAPAP